MDSGLQREFMREMLIREQPPPRCVLFVDMLGFSDLTERHPDPIVWDFESDDISAGTSESQMILGRFQHVLDTVPADWRTGFRPTHVMLFSDCAYLVFDKALQAALCATELMRQFMRGTVPVRMGLAYGTWHVQRFSFDFADDLTTTRAVFYGTGVVYAHNAERYGGKGCRIFVHPSVDEGAVAQVREKVQVLDIETPHLAAPRELNYLFAEPVDELGKDNDWKLHRGLKAMHDRIPLPVPDYVERQYTETVAAMNRMRQHLSRGPLNTDLSR